MTGVQTCALPICPGTNIIDVPITVESFSNVRDISLTMKYDARVMTYLGFTSEGVTFGSSDIKSNGYPIANDLNSDFRVIRISKTSGYIGNQPVILDPITDGEVLVTLHFSYNTGNTSLVWIDNDGSSCEYSYLNTDGDPDNWENEVFCDTPTGVYYINGSVKILGGMYTTIDPIASISSITGTPVIIPVTVNYPDLVAQEVDDNVLTDARISYNGTGTFPAGSRIFNITYNGTPVLASPVVIGGESEILLSEILGSAPTSLLGHTSQSVNWEIFVDGINDPVTIPVMVEALAYININDCETVLDTKTFEATFADVTVSTIADLTVCAPADLVYSYTMTYPLVANNGGIRILNDSKITFWADAALSVPVELPIGTTIEVHTPVGNTKASTLTAAVHTVYGSAIVAQQGDPSSNTNGYLLPLTRTDGTDNWTVTIKDAPAGSLFVKEIGRAHV